MHKRTMPLKFHRILYFGGLDYRLIGALFFVLFTVVDPVPATGKPTAEQGLNKCYKYTDPEIAVAYCTQAIESGRLSGKGLAFAFYKRGNAYNEQGDYDRAIKDYDEAIRLNPAQANAWANRGVAFAAKRDYDRAIENYNEAIRLNPNHADAFSNRGVAYARKGDYDQAIENYNEAIRLNPGHANALFGRGNAYRRKKDYDRAIEDYNQALRLNPKHVNALSNRGIAYGHKGEHDLAIQSYDEALRLNPRHLNALYNRGNAYTRKGAYDQAVNDYDQVLQLNPKHANARSSRGTARFFQGRFSAAVPDLSEALRFAPNNLYRMLLLYLAQARAGNHGREALAQAAQGLDLAKWPGPIVSMYLGDVPEQLVLDSATKAGVAERPQRRCQAYFYVGQQLMIRQQSVEAARMFRETLATNASALFEFEAAQVELKRLGN